jgi:sugar transferase (PEP-CTERM/EpsH1 system associated)
VGKYRSRAFARRLRDLLAERIFDLIVCDFLPPAIHLPGTLPCRAVIFTHNVESEIWRRHAEIQTGAIGRYLYERQHRRMLRFERQTLARFDGVLVVSEADRRTFERLYPGAIRRPAHVVPTGVDTGYFRPAEPCSSPESRSIVFTGSMDWLPNEDAMVLFCREMLPLIRRTVPDVTVSIVGRAPTPTVTALARQHGVIVTGRVDDVRPFVRDAAVYVVPLRIGGGTRLKIFEAMAMGKAVVSTAIGAEGLPVTDGEHLLLADEPRAFADAVVRLLGDVEQRRRLEVAARSLVLAHYDWSAVAGEMEAALIRFAGLRPHDAAPHTSASPTLSSGVTSRIHITGAHPRAASHP